MKRCWLQRIAAVVLCAGLLVSGCKAKESKSKSKDKEETGTETTTETEESKSTSAFSMPTDRQIEAMYQNIDDDQNIFVVDEFGEIKLESLDKYTDTMILMMTAYDMSEDAYKDAQDMGGNFADMTYQEYLDYRYESLSDQYKSYFDDYKLKEMPDIRLAIGLTVTLDPETYGEDFILSCITAGFELIFDTPELLESIENTLHADEVDNDTAAFLAIMVSLDTDMSVLVSTSTSNYALNGIVEESVKIDNPYAGDNQMGDSATLRVSNSLSSLMAGSEMSFQMNGDKARKLFEQMEELVSDGQSVIYSNSTAYSVLAIEFDDVFQTSYKYCGDDIWCVKSASAAAEKFIKVNDSETSQRLVDECVATVILPMIDYFNRSIDGEFFPDFSQIFDESVVDDWDPDINVQYLSCALSSEHNWKQFIYRDGDEEYYYEAKFCLNGYDSNGDPEYEMYPSYEYISTSAGKYSRHNDDSYQETDVFEGQGFHNFIFGSNGLDMTFEYGFAVDYNGWEYRCEIYDHPNYRFAILFDTEGEMIAGWRYTDTWNVVMDDHEPDVDCHFVGGALVFYELQTDTIDFDMTDLKKAASSHASGPFEPGMVPSADQTKYTAADWIRVDQKTYGLPDLTLDIVEGKTLSGSPVVKDFLEYMSETDEYTLKFWALGDYTCARYDLTSDGKDYYFEGNVIYHDNYEGYDWLYAAIGDYEYDGDSSGIQKSKRDNSQNNTKALIPPELLNYDYMNFNRAYEATLGDESYIIEEWTYSTIDDTPITFYCKDDKVVGYSMLKYDYYVIRYITDFKETADKSMLKAPC